ncbi:hypothetical protein BDL97_01G095100 [Sphagnum fallax]|jgi:hypothetical protein|nr:hypothetical protein BDL97_01G095100 [Sphagnum fallax]
MHNPSPPVPPPPLPGSYYCYSHPAPSPLLPTANLTSPHVLTILSPLPKLYVLQAQPHHSTMQLKHKKNETANNRLTDSSPTAGNNKTSKLITQQLPNGSIYGFPDLNSKSTYNKRVEEKKSPKVC